MSFFDFCKHNVMLVIKVAYNNDDVADDELFCLNVNFILSHRVCVSFQSVKQVSVTFCTLIF